MIRRTYATHGAQPHLTPREQEVLRWLAEGNTVHDTATILRIALRTADAHVYNMMQKLDVTNRAELVIAGIRLGIVPCPCPAHALAWQLLPES
jgi:DNA-binding CsgD family transcriptional regulator